MKPGIRSRTDRNLKKPFRRRFGSQKSTGFSGPRHKGYQTLLKEFVMERLYEEEKREGLVGRFPRPNAGRPEGYPTRNQPGSSERPQLMPGRPRR